MLERLRQDERETEFAIHDALSSIFDENFYRARYPDIRDGTIDTLRHYFEVGWREGRDPNRWFSTRLYLFGHPDVVLSGISPIMHYLSVGRAEGRRVWPPLAHDGLGAESEVIRAEFDEEYYRRRYPDVVDVSGAEHYCLFGWKEGRDPAPWFCTGSYIARHKTVRDAGVNPFVHYLLTGRDAGYATEPGSFDSRDAPPAIQCHIDTAVIDDAGILKVRGWVVSLSPIQKVSVFLNGGFLGQAHRGLLRPDVVTAYPKYPDAALGGFQFQRILTAQTGPQVEVRISIESLGGIDRAMTIPVVVPPRRREVQWDPAISHEVDTISLTEDGALSIAGWAFAGSGLSKIEVGVGEGLAGLADFGLDRPDVGNLYPLIPSAAQAGFRFNKALKTRFQGETQVWLRLYAVDGTTKRTAIAVRAAPVRDSKAAPAARGINYYIDSPIVRNGVAEPVRGNLTLAGWAMAPGGIRSIDVEIDGEGCGHAYHGIRRQDIHAVHPKVSGALLSGFAMAIPRKKLPIGEHSIAVTIHGKHGERAQSKFTIQADPDVSQIGNLRGKLRQVEIDLKRLLIRDAAKRAPDFLIVVALPNGSVAERNKAGATLKSIAAQEYDRWRVVLMLRNGKGEHCRALLDMPGCEGRINLGEMASNRITASHVMRLRAGDMLGVDALLELALAQAETPTADLIYADDRRCDPDTKTMAAYFKPDWSPELLLSTNYIGRAFVATKGLLLRAKLDLGALSRSNDYQMILRLTEAARQIQHIAKVLVEQGGMADSERDAEALRATLARQGVAASVTLTRFPGVFEVQRRLTTEPRVSVIIPTIASRGLIEETIASLRHKTDYKNIEIICLDNIPPGKRPAGTPPDRDWKQWLRENVDLVIDIQEKFNWSRFNNVGAAEASGEVLLFLNDDIEVIDPRWLHRLLEHAERREVGVVGPLLLYPDGKVQHGGIFLSHEQGRHAFRFADPTDPGPFGLAFCQRNMIAVTGACMLMRRDAFAMVGGFDESHAVVNNDLDYCLRAQRAGQQVIYTPHARLIHHELASRAGIGDIYDKRSFKVWKDVFRYGDPYNNRQVSRDYDDYTPEPEPTETLFVGHPLRARERINRILAIKIDHIGDFITALPAFARLRQRFPEAKITALVPRASVSLAKSLPDIDTVIEFNFFHIRSGKGQRKISKATLSALRAQLTALQFDLAIDLRRQPDTREVLQYTEAKLLAGFDSQNRFFWLDVALEWETDTRLARKRAHVSDYLVDLVDTVATACAPRPPAPLMAPLGLDKQRARATLAGLPAIKPFAAALLDHGHPIICLHPGVGAATRQWPAEHFGALIDLFVERHQARCMLIGSPDEGAIAQSVLDNTEYSESTFNLIGKTAVDDLGTVLRASDLVIGNNSGPHHLAAALGIPTVGVHSGVVDAVEWGPRGANALAVRRRMSCSPCYLEKISDCHRNHACLRELYPGDVYRACRLLLMVSLSRKGE